MPPDGDAKGLRVEGGVEAREVPASVGRGKGVLFSVAEGVADVQTQRMPCLGAPCPVGQDREDEAAHTRASCDAAVCALCALCALCAIEVGVAWDTCSP
jgi:hypothetical protein